MDGGGRGRVIGRLFCASNDRTATPIYSVLSYTYPLHTAFCAPLTIEWLMAKCVNYVESIHIVHFHAAAAVAFSSSCYHPAFSAHLHPLTRPIGCHLMTRFVCWPRSNQCIAFLCQFYIPLGLFTRLLSLGSRVYCVFAITHLF